MFRKTNFNIFFTKKFSRYRIYFITFITSAFISNAAVAIILSPLAILLSNHFQISNPELLIDPTRAFLMAICFGASASFMTPTLMFSINMMEAARRQKVKRYLFTSSIGVYSPRKRLLEGDVWKTFPSKKDYIPGWTKRICELQAEAFKIEYNFKNVSIVRPANVYGPFDNFDETNGMVIPSLISKAFKSKKYLKVWGDGSEIRDFIYSTDVAKGMAMTLYEGIKYPINLGSGKGVSIRTIAEVIAKSVPNGPLKVSWDKSKPSGDKIRLMNVTKAIKMGFKANIDIVTGIKNTIDWYANSNQHKRYNAFTEKF